VAFDPACPVETAQHPTPELVVVDVARKMAGRLSAPRLNWTAGEMLEALRNGGLRGNAVIRI
jgi:hypothetical protein